ncbi:MAG: flagellar hook-basal body protein [Lachnospiraceae bacterium]|nr:flagellar hook-basal body protein [Lachnospiraceae bacterium]
MMRSLWTGATGMVAQQNAVDTISNNIANVNTTGYKKETVEFKSLLYTKLQTKTTDNEGNVKPVIGQVGVGTRTASITSRYTQGALNATGNNLDFALEGQGFFKVLLPNGEVGYTRNGTFQASQGPEGLTLCTADGYPVLDSTGSAIVFPAGTDSSTIEVDEEGKFFRTVLNPVTSTTVNDEGGEVTTTKYEKELVNMEISFGVAQFNNPSGLEKTANSILLATESSGEERLEGEDTEISRSKVHAQYIEASNVNLADEMVNLIVAQRAYEMNSKIINASDEMLQQANNLRG